MSEWIETGSPAPGSLGPARVRLHYAALLLGSTADSILPAADDDSQTNLGFDPASGRLETHSLEGPHRTVAFLETESLTLGLRNARGTAGRLPLSGQSLATAVDWMRGQLSEAAGLKHGIQLREYEGFPESRLARGGTFEPGDDAALAELTVWFRNGQAILESLRPRHPRMSPLRVWPHHLDLGALIPLDGSEERMIGLGLSPGDEQYDQPYFYCTPYPAPAAQTARPALRVGHWHTDGFISAVATGDELQAGQGRAAERYMADAIAACEGLIGSR